MDEQISKVREALKKISVSIEKESNDGDALFDATGAQTGTRSLVAGLVLLAVLVALSIWVLISVTRPLAKALAIVERVADGDLAVEV